MKDCIHKEVRELTLEETDKALSTLLEIFSETCGAESIEVKELKEIVSAFNVVLEEMDNQHLYYETSFFTPPNLTFKEYLNIEK